jgi:hypothetical protein
MVKVGPQARHSRGLGGIWCAFLALGFILGGVLATGAGNRWWGVLLIVVGGVIGWEALLRYRAGNL